MKRTLTFLFTLCTLTACLAQPRLYHSFNNLGGLTEKLLFSNYTWVRYKNYAFGGPEKIRKNKRKYDYPQTSHQLLI